MSEKVKAILVDDEEAARNVLESLLKRFCPEVELLGKYSNVVEAVDGINAHHPNVVFLDIEMPNYAGYEIVDFFDNIDFEIVFVTAYDKYALKAFEVSAVDYLLKPIDIDRLKQSVEKLTDRVKYKNSKQLEVLKETLKSNKVENIIVIDKGYYTKLALSDVVALEAKESYCTVYTSDKKYTVSKNLKHFETALQDVDSFFRTHKSWLINTDFIESYSKSELEIILKHGITAKLSKYKKVKFEEVFAL